MKYAWIEKYALRWPVCVQCPVLKVSVSGYHQHLARRKKIATRRHLSDQALLVEIRAVHVEMRGAYGWPRMWRQLKQQGVRNRCRMHSTLGYLSPVQFEQQANARQHALAA